MEFLIFIILIVIFALVLNLQSSQHNNSDRIQSDLSVLKKQLHELKEQLASLQQPVATAIINNEQQQKEKEAAELKAQEENKQKIADIEAMRLERREKQKA